MKNHQITKRFWVLLIVFAGVGALASYLIGMQQSVWFDEAYSVLVAQQPIGEIIRLAAADTHPPLYYLFLHEWGTLFGWGESALRVSSALVFGGAIAVAGVLVKRLFGMRAALATLLLLIVSPLLVRYGFEIRSYALASFIGITATYVMIRAENSRTYQRWWWLLYALFVAIGMATLYNLLYLWMAHLVWLAWVYRREKRLSWRAPWLWSYVLSVIFFLPQLPTFLSQLTNGALAPISQPLTLQNLFGIISFNTVYQPFWALGAFTSLLVLAVMAGLAYLSVKSKVFTNKYAVLFALYFLFPIAILMLISLARPLYVERYLSHIAIGGVILVAVMAAAASRHHTRIVGAVFVGIVISMGVGIVQLTNVGNYNFQRMQKPDVKSLAYFINTCDANSSVIANEPYVATELQYYLRNKCDIAFYKEWDTLRGGYAPYDKNPLQFRTLVMPAQTKTLYYVYYDSPRLLAPASYRIVSTKDFGSMHVQTLSAE